MMKSAIMQPYLFPYIGYFQLIHAADTFVIYDDVQYIKRGWINRNRFLQNGEENLYTFSLKSDSSRKNINERYFTPHFAEQCGEFLKMLQFAYGSAPYFERTKGLVEEVFEEMKRENIDENIAVKIGRSIKTISGFLNLETAFILSSDLEKDNSKMGQELIIEINYVLDAATYINPINGKELYNLSRFKNENIDLYFIESKEISYQQFNNDFIPWLSIIDVCMFNSPDEVRRMLRSYTLIQ